jgi:hypothetical protein
MYFYEKTYLSDRTNFFSVVDVGIRTLDAEISNETDEQRSSMFSCDHFVHRERTHKRKKREREIQ